MNNAQQEADPKIQEQQLIEELLQNAERKALFNTKLKPDEENQFQDWLKEQSELKKRDAGMDLIDYDSRGLWKALQEPNSEGLQDEATGHSSDKFKKPWHPTFSNQSIYHSEKTPGGEWSKDEKGNDVFNPSPENLKYWPPEHLQKYFKQREPDVILKLPEPKEIP